MRITIINVGYGDAILLESESGYRMLLDGGSLLPGEFEGDPYRIRAVDYLKARGITHLDAVWISHIHEDHVCGLEPILEQVRVERLFVPYPVEPFLKAEPLEPEAGAPPSVPLYSAALNAFRRILLRAQAGGIPAVTVGPGDILQPAGDLTIRVLAPAPSVIRTYMELLQQAWSAPRSATGLLTRLDAMSNHTSLLLRMEIGATVFLAAADSCPVCWSQVPLAELEHVNLLKLPHHGQKDSVEERFMEKMDLKYVITTSSSDRRYQSANPQVYQRLSALYPQGQKPCFLFSDERSYPPYFSRPEGFQAISLVIHSGEIIPEFINLRKMEV